MLWNSGFTGDTDESQHHNNQVDVASGTTPYTLGFRKSFKITNGNNTSGAGAGSYNFYTHVRSTGYSKLWLEL